ncbi:diguanylate cyclase domain-containing protein [Clostridium cylindrosporum]|uniref:Histidine kinase n=1 Tax=Clostridium cylindrosporum DSM 605 TaxID=1121307 RepID=A0A0J8D5P3_CLOCY|nr:diguanylate cyclase [Clostridium cylindrosporum]KMT21167.1 histidine kinase [Clostridium cylindrosporum DSM 605]
MLNSYFSNKLDFLREVYIEINNNKLIKFISENCYNILGYTQQELINKNITDYISGIPENIILPINIQSTIRLKTGSFMDIDIKITSINSIDFSGLRLSIIDISKYIKFNNNEKKLLKMFQNCKDIVYRCDLIPQFQFTYISPSIKELLGYSAEELISNSELAFEIVHPDDRETLMDKINNSTDYTLPISTRFKHKNDKYVWLEDFCIPIYSSKGKLVALEGFSRNITKKKELEEKLENLSYYDGLTNLYNKLYLENQINILNTKEDTSIGIIFCDLDNLKKTNDAFGHEFGDKLIKYTSNLLLKTFKKNSIIARSGGDEFIIIIKNSSFTEIKDLYTMLCNSIKEQNKYNKALTISLSIGYSFSETSVDKIREVINIADKNMYKDKQRKKLLI